jgi:hypothetical protein
MKFGKYDVEVDAPRSRIAQTVGDRISDEICHLEAGQILVLLPEF